MVGIAGGTGSGKSTLGRRLAHALGDERCGVVTQDNYYRDLSGLSLEARAKVNFDHPDSIDSELLVGHVRALKADEPIVMPRYDFARHIRARGGTEVPSRPVILVEGILVFVWPKLASLMDVKIFVQAPADVRLSRRVRRDIVDRGRDVDSVLAQYLATVRPMHERFVGPSLEVADLVVQGVGDNHVVVRLLAKAFMP